MDDFQKDFINKVKNPTLEGEVVGSSGAPKKPIDKRWFIIIGLILILIITLVVLLIISNTSGNNSQTSTSSGVPVPSTWVCTDGSTITVNSNKTVEWDSNIGALSGNYSESQNVIFNNGNIIGKIVDDKLIINDSTLIVLKTDNGQISCEKGNS